MNTIQLKDPTLQLPTNRTPIDSAARDVRKTHVRLGQVALHPALHAFDDRGRVLALPAVHHALAVAHETLLLVAEYLHRLQFALVDRRIVLEVLDAQIRVQPFDFRVAQRLAEKGGDLPDGRAQVADHVLVEHEQDVGLVTALPALLQVRPVRHPGI